MKYYIKTIRDTQTGKVLVCPPAKAPGDLKPYRLKYARYCAECVQLFDSAIKAAKAYDDELLFASFANCRNSERIKELKRLSKNLINLDFKNTQICKMLGIKIHSFNAYSQGHTAVNPRFLARLRLFHDGLTGFMEQFNKRLPDEGDCGNAGMGRGGNPEIHKSANR